METKYYKVTSLEELHIGLECRIQSSYGWQEGKWPEVLMKDSLTAQDYIDKGVVLASSRAGLEIKYLDKSDIEELGWKHTGKSVDEWFALEGDFDMGSWTSYKATMHYGLHDHRMYVQMWDTGTMGPHVFQGIVKNKSEFKKLMKTLNLLK